MDKNRFEKKYSFLKHKLKDIPPKYKFFKYTAIGTLVGLIVGGITTVIFPVTLLNLFGYLGVCNVNYLTLQTCNPFPYTLATFLGLLAAAFFGFIVDILRNSIKKDK